MASIYFIRHGQASFAADDYDNLSDLGQKQAAVLSEVFKERYTAPPAVLSGTMKRHKQTRDLAGMADPQSFPFYQESPQWNEYAHQEILARLDERLATPAGTRMLLANEQAPGRAFAKLFADATRRWQSGDFDGDYSETWLDFKGRVLSGLESLLTTAQQHPIILVYTSGGPISVVALKLLGLPDSQLLKMNWTLTNCGMTKVVKTKDRVFLSTLNDHSHFETTATQDFISYK